MKTISIIQLNKILVFPLSNNCVFNTLGRLKEIGVIASVEDCVFIVNTEPVQVLINGKTLKQGKRGLFNYCLN